MLRILILGGDGMLGHQLFTCLQPRHDVRCTVRQDLATYEAFGLFSAENTYPGIDVRSLARLVEVLADFRPEAVVNCVGIVKQRPTAKESIPSLEINALLPHRLSVLCRGMGARLVHLSTDCVFSGRRGNYRESDPSDAEDLYGIFNMYQAVEAQNPGIDNMLAVGPWQHGGWARYSGDSHGQIRFGSETAHEYHQTIELPFFERYLKGAGEGALPEMSGYDTGSNQWKSFDHF